METTVGRIAEGVGKGNAYLRDTGCMLTIITNKMIDRLYDWLYGTSEDIDNA